MRLKTFISCFVLILLAGCAYTGGGDNPGVRKVSLFSMLNGDDIRGKCGQVAGYERYRLVYNGLYEEQFRVYELNRGPRDGHVLKASVTNPANVAELDLKDLLSPWRPVVAERFLKDAEFSNLTAALGQAGLFGKTPTGLALASDSFWWLAVGCKEGQMFFHAWRHPAPDLATLAFVKPLLAMDETRAPLNPPRHPISHMPHMKSSADDKRFDLKVGENGLSYVTPLF